MASFTDWFDTGLKQTKNVLDLRNKVLDLDNDVNPALTPSVMPTEKPTNYFPFIALGVIVLILFKRKK